MQLPLHTAPEQQHTQLYQTLHTQYTDIRVQLATAELFCQQTHQAPLGGGLLLQAKSDTLYCFIGDLHGEWDTLLQIICHTCHMAEQEQSKPHFIILGDCIDRGEQELAILALIQAALLQSADLPFHLSFICGNHELALKMENNGYFSSDVRPAETAEKLNALRAGGHGSDALVLGRAALRLAEISPFMGELMGLWPTAAAASVIFAHASSPHRDLQELMQQELMPNCGVGKDLISAIPEEYHPAFMDDFMRGLFRPEWPTIPPRRGFLATRQGAEDAAGYPHEHRRITGRTPLAMFRGHDHITNGYRLTSYENGYFICTLNAMGKDHTTTACLRPHGGITLYRY